MPNASTPRPEYPRPQFVRNQWLNPNGSWEFEMDLKRNAEALEHEFGVKVRLI